MKKQKNLARLERVTAELKTRDAMQLRLAERFAGLLNELHNEIIDLRALVGGRNEVELKRNALNDLTRVLTARDGEEVYRRKHAILAPMLRRLADKDLSVEQLVKAARMAYDEIQLDPLEVMGIGPRKKRKKKRRRS